MGYIGLEDFLYLGTREEGTQNLPDEQPNYEEESFENMSLEL